MKKLIFGISTMSLLFFTSCEKEIQSVSHENIDNTTNVQKAMGTRYYFDNGKIPGVDGVDYGCSPSSGNCLPDVTVYGLAVSDILHDLNEEDPINHKYFFQDWSEELEEVFETRDIELVADGTYTLKIRDAGNNKFYYLIMDGLDVVSAYPITL